MNKHDANRRNSTIKTLEKAKEQLETEALYLDVGNDIDQLIAVNQALEHVEIALEKLEIEEPE